MFSIISWEAEKRGITKFLKCSSFFCVCRCFSHQLFLFFFSFFRGLLTIVLVKYFSVEQKESLGGVLWKRCLKYLLELIKKHLYQSLFLKKSCRIQTCNFVEKRLPHRYFTVSFAKFLGTLALWYICKRRSYLCKNIYCLPWCLLNKQKKCVSSVKFFKL